MKNNAIILSVSEDELINKLIQRMKQEINFGKDTVSEGEVLFNRKEACEFLKVNATTLDRWVKLGIISQWGLSGRRYYKRAEIMERLVLLNK